MCLSQNTWKSKTGELCFSHTGRKVWRESGLYRDGGRGGGVESTRHRWRRFRDRQGGNQSQFQLECDWTCKSVVKASSDVYTLNKLTFLCVFFWCEDPWTKIVVSVSTRALESAPVFLTNQKSVTQLHTDYLSKVKCFRFKVTSLCFKHTMCWLNFLPHKCT